jgi:hypothetical protein
VRNWLLLDSQVDLVFGVTKFLRTANAEEVSANFKPKKKSPRFMADVSSMS